MAKDSKRSAGPQGGVPARTPPLKALVLAATGVLIVSLGVYFNSLFNGFVWDDVETLTSQTPGNDVTALQEASFTALWAQQRASNYYRPMVGTINKVTYLLLGPGPRGFHLVNILFHAGVSLLVFLVISRLLRDWKPDYASSLFPASMAALLFATHPIHTESVAWISGLTDPSYSFFYLLSFYLYMMSDPGSGGWRPKGLSVLSLASFFLAAVCKEPGVTLPLVLIGYDYAFGKMSRLRSPLDYVRRYLPYLVVTGVYFMLRFHALQGFAPASASHGELGTSAQHISILPLFFMNYLERLIFPVNLSAFYTLHPLSSPFETQGIMALVISALFAVVAVVSLKKWKPFFFSLFLIVIPLLPALYIRATGESPFAERYLYLPSLGFTLLLAYLFAWAVNTIPRGAVSVTIVSVLLVGLYSLGTVSRNAVWRDDYSLWTDAVRKSPDGVVPHYNLAYHLQKTGNLDEATKHYRTVLRLRPNYAEAHNNLGVVYQRLGLLDEAIDEFLIAVTLKPDYASAHNNLGGCLYVKGRTDKAIEHYLIAIKIDPDYASAHNNLGVAYKKLGRIDEAVEHYQMAVKLSPTHPDYGSNLARAREFKESKQLR